MNKECPKCKALCTPWETIWVCDCCGYGKTSDELMPRKTPEVIRDE